MCVCIYIYMIFPIPFQLEGDVQSFIVLVDISVSFSNEPANDGFRQVRRYAFEIFFPHGYRYRTVSRNAFLFPTVFVAGNEEFRIRVLEEQEWTCNTVLDGDPKKFEMHTP